MTNRHLGFGFFAIGALILLLSLQLPQPLAATRIAYGAGFFPTILGVVIAVAGLLMAIFNPQDDAEDEDEDSDEPETAGWAHLIQPAIVIGAALVYILFSAQLGFLILAPLTLTGLLLMGRVPVGRSLIIGVGGSILIYILFAKLLLVPLPLGLLTAYGAYL